MNRIKKTWKTWLIIVLGLGACILIVVLAINPLIKNLLATQVERKLVGNFHYSYDHLTVDLLSRSVTLDNVTWRFPKDSTLFNHSGGISRLSIEGVSLLTLIRGNHLKIQEIRFDSLHLENRIETQIKQDSTDQIGPDNVTFNFYELIKGQIESLEVEKISMINGTAIWIKPQTNTIWRKIVDVQVNIRHLQLDSAIAATNNGWFTLLTADLEGHKAELFLPDSLHKVLLRKLRLDYSNQTIIIDSLEIIPLKTKSEMAYAQRYETDRMEMTIPKIVATGTDIGALMMSNKLWIQNILIDDLSLEVFRDKNPPIPHDLYIGLPQTALKNSTLNIKIDAIQLVNGYIRYEELSDSHLFQ